MDALHIAALSGIDVRIMIPSKPDHIFVYWASHSYVEELLDSGVKAYTYDNGFLHAKTIVIDEAAASVGSANWDIRSFRLNFETNAIIYDKKVAGELKQAYLNDLSVCTELTPDWYNSRSRYFRARVFCVPSFLPDPVITGHFFFTLHTDKIRLFHQVIKIPLHPGNILFVVDLQ